MNHQRPFNSKYYFIIYANLVLSSLASIEHGSDWRGCMSEAGSSVPANTSQPECRDWWCPGATGKDEHVPRYTTRKKESHPPKTSRPRLMSKEIWGKLDSLAMPSSLRTKKVPEINWLAYTLYTLSSKNKSEDKEENFFQDSVPTHKF